MTNKIQKYLEDKRLGSIEVDCRYREMHVSRVSVNGLSYTNEWGEFHNKFWEEMYDRLGLIDAIYNHLKIK